MFNTKQIVVLFFICFTMQTAKAQLGFSHELGIIAGPVALKSDFGVRSDFKTNAENTGIGVGLVHYINFAYRADCNCYTTDNYFNDHFKLRTELSWNKTKLEHVGKFVAPNKISEESNRLRAHTGEANTFDVGMQIEYFPLSIRSFQAYGYKFAPFLSLGAHYVAYNPKVNTDYGNGNELDFSNFYNPWYADNPFDADTNPTGLQIPVDPSSGSTWSIVSSVGVRYKISPLADIMLDLRGQYYFSDWVDGLNHELEYNKHNDWLVWLNFGYIYYLN